MNAPEMPMDASFTEIRTARLRLVPISAADADAMHSGLQCERAYDFIPGDPPASVEALRARYARQARARSPDGSERWYNWILRETGREAPIGYVQATTGADDVSNCLVAYVLFEPAWGRGFGREAVGAMIGHLAKTPGCATFTALVDTRNARSIALVEALGFTRVAEHPAADFFKGASSDEYEYVLKPAG